MVSKGSDPEIKLEESVHDPDMLAEDPGNNIEVQAKPDEVSLM